MWVFVLFVIAAGGWGWVTYGQASADGAYDLVLKKTDKAVVTTALVGQGVLEEGKAVPPGTTLSTRASQKTVFTYGPAASMRVAAQTDLVFTSTESTSQGKERTKFATVQLEKGRLWFVTGGDARWIVRTPVAIVRPSGKACEVNVAQDGSTTVISWEGRAEMAPLKHPDRAVLIGKQQVAAFSSTNTLENPHPVELSKDDAWQAWNLLETMGLEVKEKPAATH